MTIKSLMALVGAAALVAACAQQEEMTVVAPQPGFDKFGGGECEEGWIYVPGSVPELATCVPEDECEDPVFDTATGELICPPPIDRGDDNSPSDPGPRTPTGSSSTAGTAGRT